MTEIIILHKRNSKKEYKVVVIHCIPLVIKFDYPRLVEGGGGGPG